MSPDVKDEEDYQNRQAKEVERCADMKVLTLPCNRDIFVGGALPFGVVKVGIDTYEDNVSYSTLNGGYTPNGRVTAISMLHESGTGGFPKYEWSPRCH